MTEHPRLQQTLGKAITAGCPDHWEDGTAKPHTYCVHDAEAGTLIEALDEKAAILEAGLNLWAEGYEVEYESDGPAVIRR